MVLVKVRNWSGLWSVLVTGVLLFAAAWFLDANWRARVATAVVAFLLIGSSHSALELQRVRRGGRARNSDADQLARLTHLPGQFWAGVFLVVALICAVLASAFLRLTPIEVAPPA